MVQVHSPLPLLRPIGQAVKTPPFHGGNPSSILGWVTILGRIAQLGEHLPYKQGVIGSSPIAPTIYFGPVVQLVRMPACHAGGRGFEPLPGRQFYISWCGSTVEQLTCNQQVGGSIPFASSKMEEFPSGQRGRTVNPLAELSVVRIHLPPPICGSGSVVEHRLAKARVASSNLVFRSKCGCSSMVELQPSKLVAWVRFPSSAPNMVGVVKWLRHRIVAPACVGSNPITHPKIMGYSQVGKAPDFDSGIRRFESCYPSHIYLIHNGGIAKW